VDENECIDISWRYGWGFRDFSILILGYLKIKLMLVLPQKDYQTFVHDREPAYRTYTEKLGYRFIWVNKSFSEVDSSDYDGVIIPSGRAPEYIRKYPELKRILDHFMDNNKPVGALCHWVNCT